VGPCDGHVSGGWALVCTQHSSIIDVRAEAEIIRYCLQGIFKIVLRDTLLVFRIVRTPQPATGRRSAPSSGRSAIHFAPAPRNGVLQIRDAEVLTVI
jgi:hypothetical protein